MQRTFLILLVAAIPFGVAYFIELIARGEVHAGNVNHFYGVPDLDARTRDMILADRADENRRAMRTFRRWLVGLYALTAAVVVHHRHFS